jgi:hypothetical protein
MELNMKLDKRTLLAIVYLIVVLILVFTAPACTKKEESLPKCDESEFHDARFEYLTQISNLKSERDDLLLLLGSTAGACFIKEYPNNGGEDYYKLGVIENRVKVMKRSEFQTIDDMKSTYAWRETRYDISTQEIMALKRVDCKKVPK